MRRKEFMYDLADEKIAKHPIYPRHNSKLLLYKNGEISSQHFYDLPHLLPKSCQLIVNNAKVIPARIFCKKPTGAGIEIFLLEPIGDYLSTFANTNSVVWKVLVGNKKRWKEGSIADIGNLCSVNWVNRDENIVSITTRDDLSNRSNVVVVFWIVSSID